MFCLSQNKHDIKNISLSTAAGRVRALRGGRTSRGAGAALRAYALHLAQDKSTTFAQNIDNFIACTLDSKEASPQVKISLIQSYYERIVMIRFNTLLKVIAEHVFYLFILGRPTAYN